MTPQRGQRIALVRCNDPYTRLEPGEMGTVTSVDSMGTIHVKWDSGSTLGLCPDDGDAYRELLAPLAMGREPHDPEVSSR